LLVPVRGRKEAGLVGPWPNDPNRFIGLAILRSAPYDVLYVDARREAPGKLIYATKVTVFALH
jgi:hypothetical protein